jgi:phospho-N-acetylmuramoyl-pentapeptide-transferase
VSLDLDVFYFPWAVLVIVATCNAVNLADGLDGLAGGCTAIVSAAMLGLGFLMIHLGAGLEDAAEAGAGGAEMCVVAAAILGSALGFLWYNVHPAQVFMGDTGALAIGGLLGYIALVLKLEAALLLAGVIFFVDEVTVFLQIAIYKITHKRIFPIAPIHHYFQTGLKWPEQKITARLWIIAGLGALISFALIRLRGS